jgi:hypothetical protein
MAYPIVSAPYGLKPVDLVGGQQFAGSTRNLPIQYGYATNIFFGDFVQLTRGNAIRLAVTAGSSTTFPVGIFLGCSFTDPVTKQKRFSQYWPAGTLAGDAVAVVTDDPDTVFRAVMLSSGTVVGAASTAVIGQNMQLVDNAGNINTGDSLNGVQALSATPVTTSTFPVRVIALVPETAITTSATGSSSGTTVTLTGTGLPTAVLAGSEVGYIAANGQYVHTGSFITANAAVNATTLTLNQAVAVPGSITAIPTASTVVITQYQEVKVKINFGQHAYYAGLGVA